LKAGEYSYAVKYAGDKYFNAAETTVTVKVSKLASSVKVTVDATHNVGDAFTITVTNSTAATVTVNGKSYAIKADGTVDIDTTTLTAGNYTVKADIAESDKYLASSDTATFTIVSKKDTIGTVIVMQSTFSRYATDYNAGERGEFFYGTLYDVNGKALANKTVQITVNGVIYDVVTDNKGKAGLAVNLAAANTYTYALLFCGDDDYNASLIASSKLTVVAKPTSIIANNMAFKTTAKTKTVTVALNTIKNQFDGKMYLKKGKKLTLTVGGKTYTASTDKNGIAKFNIKLSKKGKYSATIKFEGDGSYAASSKKITITLSKSPSKNKQLSGVGVGMTPKDLGKGGPMNIVGDYSEYLLKENISTGDNIKDKKDVVLDVDKSFTRLATDYNSGERGDYFYATLKDADGKPLAGKTVQIAVNGPIYNVVTDAKGQAGLQVNLGAANTYTYALSFSGDDTYNPAKLASSKLTVTKKSTSIEASNVKFKASAKTKTVTVTLKTDKNKYDGKMYLNKGKKLTLTVNGQTYSAKTKDINTGVVKFNIKLSKKGKYSARISFAGDGTYAASSKNIKITLT
jgi:uncharacterized protein YegP (UPF0339 family)